MFTENDQEALSQLLNHSEIPEAFYYYWNDAVNTTGYSAKLLLMFSAIEALVKKNEVKDLILLEDILGKELVNELFEKSNKGLRHRLVHGEYLGSQDRGKNFLDLVHNKVIHYFNTKILSCSLIQENITSPQRHFFGNKKECNSFVKTKDELGVFSIKDLLNDFKENGFRTPVKYEHVSGVRIDNY